MKDNQVPVPWAYFSFDQEPTAEDDQYTLMERCYEDQGFCDHFISTLPNVDAEVLWVAIPFQSISFGSILINHAKSVRARCSSYGLEDFEAEFLRLVHVLRPSEGLESQTSARLEEIIEW